MSTWHTHNTNVRSLKLHIFKLTTWRYICREHDQNKSEIKENITVKKNKKQIS